MTGTRSDEQKARSSEKLPPRITAGDSADLSAPDRSIDRGSLANLQSKVAVARVVAVAVVVVVVVLGDLPRQCHRRLGRQCPPDVETKRIDSERTEAIACATVDEMARLNLCAAAPLGTSYNLVA